MESGARKAEANTVKVRTKEEPEVRRSSVEPKGCRDKAETWKSVAKPG